MRDIIRIQFGSHLYGTSTPASDMDYKAIHVPPARDILLQRAARSISTHRPKGEGEKNYAGEIDEESYSLQHFLKLLAEGQTVATDVLFAPDWAIIGDTSAEWQEIVDNRHRLVTCKSAAFIGYCRQQANKYGIKGSRVAAARIALSMMDGALSWNPTTTKLGTFALEISLVVSDSEHMNVVEIPLPNGVAVKHWEVCGRKLPYTSSIKNARDIMFKLVEEYGHRALEAERQSGVDWKALSHAVRVGTQAIELLSTGYVTFPSPNAAHLVAIKTGQLTYQQVAEEIEALLPAVEDASAKSTLRAEPDRKWIEDFVSDTYAFEVGSARFSEWNRRTTNG
jgi:hypothetical protein